MVATVMVVMVVVVVMLIMVVLVNMVVMVVRTGQDGTGTCDWQLSQFLPCLFFGIKRGYFGRLWHRVNVK